MHPRTEFLHTKSFLKILSYILSRLICILRSDFEGGSWYFPGFWHGKKVRLWKPELFFVFTLKKSWIFSINKINQKICVSITYNFSRVLKQILVPQIKNQGADYKVDYPLKNLTFAKFWSFLKKNYELDVFVRI